MKKALFSLISALILTGGMISSSYSFPKGIVAYYPLDGTADDFGGNALNGTNYGATTVPGMHGSAFYFNGSTSYISVPDNSLFIFNSGMSISAWIKPELNNMWYRIVDKEGSTSSTTSSNEWAFGMALTGGLYFGISKGTTQSSANGANPVTLNTWWHVTGTWDGITMHIYLNGIMQTESAQVTPPINHSTYPVLIGKGANSTYYFKGIIDELLIYNRALTAAEVDSLYRGYFYSGIQSPNPGRVLKTQKALTVDVTAARRGILITCFLDRPAGFSADIFSPAGACVATLSRTNAAAGNQTVFWEGNDRTGKAVPNGNYFIVCMIDNKTVSKKFIVMR
jgi:hypothetical protein